MTPTWTATATSNTTSMRHRVPSSSESEQLLLAKLSGALAVSLAFASVVIACLQLCKQKKSDNEANQQKPVTNFEAEPLATRNDHPGGSSTQTSESAAVDRALDT
ncbi:hypothetical protein Slin15195_G086880 [Septoria linicola]|uniref:Uncharacterized protein n=1 Tax=Septoria linicola TaxID=215465 RepID=A0A9Q9ATY5_9PEZI|nr:hypothetical protein Slin14017_G089470 [Septoria linicola]USW55369.1 hypothetical protein Slin15195_G086880 [Septoria linicola]